MPLTQTEKREIAHQVAEQVVSRVKEEIPELTLQVMGDRERLAVAKEEAARIAAEEVEKQWHSPKPK